MERRLANFKNWPQKAPLDLWYSISWEMKQKGHRQRGVLFVCNGAGPFGGLKACAFFRMPKNAVAMNKNYS